MHFDFLRCLKTPSAQERNSKPAISHRTLLTCPKCQASQEVVYGRGFIFSSSQQGQGVMGQALPSWSLLALVGTVLLAPGCVHVLLVCGCFPATVTAELGPRERDCTACEAGNIYRWPSCRSSFLTPGLGCPVHTSQTRRPRPGPCNLQAPHSGWLLSWCCRSQACAPTFHQELVQSLHKSLSVGVGLRGSSK